MAEVLEEHSVKIKNTEWVTHNVRRFTLERPENYDYEPGQATELAINLPEWKEERRPFTFTGLNDSENLEFTIKIYTDHEGVTNKLGQLENGDELLLHDVWGAIHYKGPGVFIAGGAGVTPFIAILRNLDRTGKLDGNKLIFSNTTVRDIILKDEFEQMLGNNFINTITGGDPNGYDSRKIDKSYLSDTISKKDQYFYICGPDKMVTDIKENLLKIGVREDKIVTEDF